ncbi:MAG: helix-turn-helix domain-containing protein [Sedimentisphaeraceae bacterium JB056]
MVKQTQKSQPAIFYDSLALYRADSCEPLKNAADKEELFLDGYGRRSYPGKRLPANVMPQLCLYCVWDAKHRQNWGLGEHRNEGLELGFISSGKLDFSIDGQDHSLDSGYMTITRPWQPHKVGNPEIDASRVHWLIIDLGVRRPSDKWDWPDWMVFSRKEINHLTELLSHNEQSVWRANKAIERCFENMAKAISEVEPENAETRMKLLINELFLELYELLQKKDIKLNPNLVNTRRTVEIFLSKLKDQVDYLWSLEDMAKQCNLGRSRFSLYCKEITNMTPLNYLNYCRVQKAAKMLLSENFKSITDVAFKCGFESSQYFSTVFKKHMGCCPREFQVDLSLKSTAS